MNITTAVRTHPYSRRRRRGSAEAEPVVGALRRTAAPWGRQRARAIRKEAKDAWRSTRMLPIKRIGEVFAVLCNCSSKKSPMRSPVFCDFFEYRVALHYTRAHQNGPRVALQYNQLKMASRLHSFYTRAHQNGPRVQALASRDRRARHKGGEQPPVGVWQEICLVTPPITAKDVSLSVAAAATGRVVTVRRVTPTAGLDHLAFGPYVYASYGINAEETTPPILHGERWLRCGKHLYSAPLLHDRVALPRELEPGLPYARSAVVGAPGAERLVTSPDEELEHSYADVWDMRSGRRLFTVTPRHSTSPYAPRLPHAR